MKFLRQMMIIAMIYYAGNLISKMIDSVILIPGSIIGMLILFALLSMDWVKLGWIQETGEFLLKYMNFFFVPFGVSILESMDILQGIWLKLLLVIFISTACVMFVTMKSTEFLMNLSGKGRS